MKEVKNIYTTPTKSSKVSKVSKVSEINEYHSPPPPPPPTHSPSPIKRIVKNKKPLTKEKLDKLKSNYKKMIKTICKNRQKMKHFS